eukprot:TRINITY_DN1378_c0_g1_i1.p1 TRINITY_DN1378_c0_g1~~TRINITY_DN1378_c0_g1_i1.p1  ORF type:complete len:266 (-),score=37.89 TRINITY_DN1378_c0_g1_i1:20-817(-)
MWIYDTLKDLFFEVKPQPSLLPAVSRHNLVTIDNFVYWFGGITQEKKKLNCVVQINPYNGSWREMPVLIGKPPSPRCNSVVVNYRDTIIVFGGSEGDRIFTSDIHIYNPKTGEWYEPTVRGASPSPRIGCCGAVIGNSMYIFGGGEYNKVTQLYSKLFSEIWKFDLLTYTWTLESSSDVIKHTTFLNMIVIGNQLIVEGAWNTYPFAYDTISKIWRKIKLNKHENNNESSSVILNNTAYYYGGFTGVYQHNMTKVDFSPLAFVNE